MKINNFSAGPSKIPQIVLDQIAKDIIDYQDLGYSVLELSHRSTIFEKILRHTKAKLIQILVFEIFSPNVWRRSITAFPSFLFPFSSFSDENINILAISTSEIKLSVIIDEENTLKAIKKLHTIFDLD